MLKMPLYGISLFYLPLSAVAGVALRSIVAARRQEILECSREGRTLSALSRFILWWGGIAIVLLF
jgi:hypothetical protein